MSRPRPVREFHQSWLLAAYPARLRRKHGDELIATLAEMSGPGGGPSRAEQVRLVLDGLRERFRPPVRRPLALAAAVLALLVGGALGAAAGSWVGTFGYADLPAAVPVGERLTPVNADGSYLWAEGRFPAGAGVQAESGVQPESGTQARPAALAAALAAVEQTHRAMAAAGWRPGPIAPREGVLTNVHFTAERDGVRLDVYAYPTLGTISVAGWPTRPATYVPLTIAGLLAGLVAGWLAGVAVAHRIQAARRPVRSGVLAVTGLVLVLPSAVGFVAALVNYLTVTDPLGTGGLLHAGGFAFGPTADLWRAYDMGEGWVLTPSDLQLLPLFGFALIAVGAILARPRREREAVA
ncbi:hypothetical protein [Paractinoplanes brasiliensis]|uniref:Uncharacterized protein n=1 Tax=Paractinoplanes brasiliensis TaxID=52695 RepID=A0A4R6JBD9_9ACTN|nr:hypothetical protein [Actinoplanes brasiliensis]TDO32842.1 hypothetical protein C8E87_8314 [Actinoplanes brasiliensis]GID31613.1 hypothetical protein Abr02nite_65960 [Actinoplanes brasiliensis]